MPKKKKVYSKVGHKNKSDQLGMNYSTASYRLFKDFVFSVIKKFIGNKCFRCGKPMTRANFSIDHKVPWQNTSNPKKLFWDLNNISFSHMSCNYSQSHKNKKDKK